MIKLILATHTTSLVKSEIVTEMSHQSKTCQTIKTKSVSYYISNFRSWSELPTITAHY